MIFYKGKEMSKKNQNPNYENDVACISTLLEGLPSGIIASEKFWLYCTSHCDTLQDAFECYFNGTGLNHKWASIIDSQHKVEGDIMIKFNDGLTKSQRKTCAKIFVACVTGGWKEIRVTYETMVCFESWLHERKLSQKLTEEQLAKFTLGRWSQKRCHCGSVVF